MQWLRLLYINSSYSDQQLVRSLRKISVYLRFFAWSSGVTGTSVIFLATNLSVSSSNTTGTEIFNTAIHSSMLSGVIWKTVERTSTSRMRKWRDMERAMAPMSHLLHQGGITVSDWFSEMLLTAFNISIVTSTDRAIVMGLGLAKIPQSMLGNILGSAKHCI